MQRKWTVCSLALGIALGSTSNLPAQAPDFTTIDFPGGAGTQAWAINPRGAMVGSYTFVDKSSHGFVVSGERYITNRFPRSYGNHTRRD